MLQWIDFVAIAVVAILFVLAMRHTVKKRKSGSCCGGKVKKAKSGCGCCSCGEKCSEKAS